MSERFDISIDKNNPNAANIVDEKTGITAFVQTNISEDNNDISIYVSRLDRPICLTLEDKEFDEDRWISTYRDLMYFILFGTEREIYYAKQENTSMDESE